MKQNLTKTDERGVHIDNLATSSENVNHQSLQFKASARKVKRQMCVSNMKWTFILIGVAIIVIVVIIAVCKLPINLHIGIVADANRIFLSRFGDQAQVATMVVSALRWIEFFSKAMDYVTITT